MKTLNLIFLLLFLGACTPTFVRYSDIPHTENAQRIKVISKTKLKYEVLKHWSPEVLRDTIMDYKPCKVLEGGYNCLIYLEKGHVIEFKGSYFIKSSAWVNYVGQEKFKKYINKDLKF